MKFEIKDVEKAIEIPFEKWAHDCHTISLAIVKSDLIEGPRRVARGWCDGVRGQHSWVVVGNDCYADDAKIIDATLWSYDDSVEGIWFGSMTDDRHTPHGGKGTIWTWGQPAHCGGESIELKPEKELSSLAATFLEMLGPLDYMGWGALASQAPVGGWPAAEIIEAMYHTPELQMLIPIDRVGMLTDINPSGLYLPDNLICA
jgi:hypothetical protein